MFMHFKKFLIACAIVFSAFAPAMVFAQSAEDVGVIAVQESDGFALGSADLRETAVRLINVALGFLGIIAVVIVLIGGFKYMLSGGNQDKTDEARKMIVSGFVGIAIVIGAWAITTFVLGQLVEALR